MRHALELRWIRQLTKADTMIDRRIGNVALSLACGRFGNVGGGGRKCAQVAFCLYFGCFRLGLTRTWTRVDVVHLRPGQNVRRIACVSGRDRLRPVFGIAGILFELGGSRARKKRRI